MLRMTPVHETRENVCHKVVPFCLDDYYSQENQNYSCAFLLCLSRRNAAWDKEPMFDHPGWDVEMWEVF